MDENGRENSVTKNILKFHFPGSYTNKYYYRTSFITNAACINQYYLKPHYCLISGALGQQRVTLTSLSRTPQKAILRQAFSTFGRMPDGEGKFTNLT